MSEVSTAAILVLLMVGY